MSAAHTLLEEARAAGFAIVCRGDKLRVQPTPPAELIEQLRQNKAAIIGLLTPRRPDQLELARRATRHPLPPGAPVCATCGLLLCGEGRRRGNELYHRACLSAA